MGVTSLQGYECELAIKATSPVDGSAIPLEPISHGVRRVSRVHHTNGMRGERQRNTIDADEGEYLIRGPIFFEATPRLMDIWLPYIGFTEAPTDTWTPVDNPPGFYLGGNLGGVDAFEWGQCKVARCTWQGQSGGALIMRIDVLGQTESSLSYPSLMLPVTADNNPYLFKESASGLSLVDDTREMESFEITWDNVINPVWRNSMTPTSLEPEDLEVFMSTMLPYISGNVEVYDQAFAGAAASLTFTSGAMSTEFAFANCINEKRTPAPERGKKEVHLPLRMWCFKSGSTPLLTIDNDATP